MADEPDCTDRRALMLEALNAAGAGVRNIRHGAAENDQEAGRVSGRAEGHPDVRHLHAVHSPAECKVVEGFVAITGWCNAFDLAD
jgi:hypothetical protein